MKSFTQLKNESNQVGVQFVLTELEMGLSFLDIANHSSDLGRQQLLYSDAKKAHDTVTRFLPRFDLTLPEQFTIKAKLQQLRSRMQHHGISVAK